MASNLEFVEYVCEKISKAGNITYQKMFGEYGIYCNGKIIGLICNNKFFLKQTQVGKTLLRDVVEEAPYKGAKLYFYIEELDDIDFLSNLIQMTYEELPFQKKKK